MSDVDAGAAARAYMDDYLNRQAARATMSITIPPDSIIVTDPDTGGRKGQKLAQFSQIPADVLWELAEHYGKGNEKYPDDQAGKANWSRGYSWRLSVDAMQRHLMLWLQGESIDAETGSSHLVAAIWHLFTLRYFEIHDLGKDFR